MTVIVAAPLQPAPPVDIPFSHLKAAVTASNNQNQPVVVDPAVPRAVLAHTIVAAAAALPSLAPSLPSHEPEYRLASKRKSPDGPDDDDALENLDSPKRPRTSSDQDSLFGPLSSPQLSSRKSLSPPFCAFSAH